MAAIVAGCLPGFSPCLSDAKRPPWWPSRPSLRPADCCFIASCERFTRERDMDHSFPSRYC